MLFNSSSWRKVSNTFLKNQCGSDSIGYPHGNLQKIANEVIVKKARQLKAPLLLTLDAHMVKIEHKILQDIVLKNGSETGWHFSNAYAQKNTKQTWDSWREHQGWDKEQERIFAQAVESNSELVSRIENITLEKTYHLPEVDLPLEIVSAEPNDLSRRYRRYLLTLVGKYGRIPEDPELYKIYRDRLEKELQVIQYNGIVDFSPYFIVLHDEVCSFAQRNEIPMGPGRGSAAGCLLSYCLRITHIDPIKHELSFERFLSQARINRGKFPDIDLDFADPGKIAQHLKQKFGDKFGRICTTGTLRFKSALRDVARVLLDTRNNSVTAETVNIVCKSLPKSVPQGLNTRSWLYGWEDDQGHHKGELELNITLQTFFKLYPAIQTAVDGLLDIPRSIGRHASAYCLSDIPLSDILPMAIIGDDNETCTQFTMEPVEALGVIKMDFLGLNTLKDIAGCVKLIKQRHNIDIDIYDGINVEDPLIFQEFCLGHTETVFQYNTDVATDLTRRVKPKTLLDLAEITAADRPGTLKSFLEDGVTKLVDAWVDRRNGKSLVEYLHPSIEPILAPTKGIVLFQEQITQMFIVACGYSEERADEIREIVGKKKKDVMQKLYPEIRRELKKRGWTSDQTKSFISLCEAASDYSFNKSHSLAYAYIGYLCMWLKTYYKLEWWTSILQNSSSDDLAKNAEFCREIVQPPDLNVSDLDFYIIENERIVYPLKMIKGVANAAKEVVKQKPYQSFEQFYTTVNRSVVNSRVVSAMIWSGAFDNICGITNPVERQTIFRNYLTLRKDKKALSEWKDLGEAEVLRRQSSAMPLGAPDFVGMMIRSGRLKKDLVIHDLSDIEHSRPGSSMIVGGIVERVHQITTKKGDQMCFLDVANQAAGANLTVFPRQFNLYQDILKVGNIVVAAGKINAYREQKSLCVEELLLFREEENEIEETD